MTVVLQGSLWRPGLPPGVYQEAPPPVGRPRVRLDVTALIGLAERGPLNTPVAIDDPRQFETVFGRALPGLNLPLAVRLFFANGGRRCVVVRCVDHRQVRTARLHLPGFTSVLGRSRRLARLAGLEARVLTLADPNNLRGDARTAWRDAQAAAVPIAPFAAAEISGAELLVDAILGTGLERDVSGAWREAIDTINAHPADRFALDIPSGLHADTGAILGVAVRAAATITFIGLKQGLFTGQGPACSGTVHFAGLDVPPDIYPALHPSCWRYAGDDWPTLLPRRARSAHKGLFGHVLVIGGELGMAGAARMAPIAIESLAAKTALRSGHCASSE